MNKCLIIGNSSLRVSPCIVINKIYFFPKETGIAKLSCLKEKQPFAVILQNSCSEKICLQSTTLFKEKLRHSRFRFPANLRNLK